MAPTEDSAKPHGGYVASSPWFDSLDEPPRVIIPPPSLDTSQGQPAMIVAHPSSVDYGSDQFGNRAFLQGLIKIGSLTFAHRGPDWRYANRREAQLILPFLYIGPFSAAKDGGFVREVGLTFLMSVRSTASGPSRSMDAVKLGTQYGLPAYNLDLNSNADLVREFSRAIKVINDHLESTLCEVMAHGASAAQICGKVLIFCETGNEKSAALVAAYLMAVFNIDTITAIQIVQSQRFSMCIDDSIKYALSTFGTLLSAKRDVGRANQSSDAEHQQAHSCIQSNQQVPVSSRFKRRLDNIDDDGGNVRMSDKEQIEGHEGRVGEAPFHDMEK